MRKKILLILIILLCPVLVLAKDTCNCKDIIIKEITKIDSTGYIEEKQEPSINNNKINLDLELFNIEDSITYDITIKNDSEEDYYFTKNSLNINSDYLEYEFLNDSEIIKRNEEKAIQLKITYKNKILEDSYNENNIMTIALANEPLTNPDTKVQYILIILIVLITSTLLFVYKKKSMKLLSILLIPLIPITTKALCNVNLEINANITINEKEALFLEGQKVNIKMKDLAGDNASAATTPHGVSDANITAIKYSETEPIASNKEEKNIVSTTDSPYPIYMWYDNGTIYWWSEAKRPCLSETASYMFIYLKKLTDISGLKYYDSSKTIDMSYSFLYNLNLKSIKNLASWNVSKVTNLQSTFANTGITSLEGLENWDVSNVKNMSSTFSNNSSLTSLEPLRKWNVSNVNFLNNSFYKTGITSPEGLENWDVSNVTNMSSTFSNNASLTSLEPLRNWNVSNVTSLYYTFTNTGIISLNGLENWNVSKVTTMISTFDNATSLTSLEALRNWDVSNVISMNGIFSRTNITNLDGLENWNVSKVTAFYGAFSQISNLTDANSINDWDIQRTANFNFMFFDAPIHPEFTKVQGTWNNVGTFTPN